jgi:hypothetical protein
MITTQDYINLFSNDQKRRAFIADYQTWGVWITQPELGLTYYKHDLPDGARIIVMEHLRTPYTSENNGEDVLMSRFHLQKSGQFFNPTATGEFGIADHLKELKAKLVKELKGNPKNATE